MRKCGKSSQYFQIFNGGGEKREERNQTMGRSKKGNPCISLRALLAEPMSLNTTKACPMGGKGGEKPLRRGERKEEGKREKRIEKKKYKKKKKKKKKKKEKEKKEEKKEEKERKKKRKKKEKKKKKKRKKKPLILEVLRATTSKIGPN